MVLHPQLVVADDHHLGLLAGRGHVTVPDLDVPHQIAVRVHPPHALVEHPQ